VREDGQPLALAGLWAGWRDATSDPESPLVVRTFTIVTTTPNQAIASLHDRMPAIVPEDAWVRWLDPALTDPGELMGLLQPTDEIALSVYAVSRAVNNVRSDGPELIEPLIVDATTDGPPEGQLGL